jgi:predicted esterase
VRLLRTASLVALAALLASAAACSGDDDDATAASKATTTAASKVVFAKAERPHAVGMITKTYVDHDRSTDAHGGDPQRPERQLVTTILYPAQGAAGSAAGTPSADAPPDTADGPYPLIAFAHGLGANPRLYQPLLAAWARAGFVVAAPAFPLTNDKTPGGPAAGDVVHQPGDISFVISSVLHDAAATTGPLAKLVDPDAVGAAGHSNGAITTLGLVANTCCHDDRVKAAVVMAGTTEHYPDGKYDFTSAPPLMIVHGTDDSLVPYDEGVATFNSARGPKALLTIDKGEHGSAAGLVAASSQPVIGATIDFLNAYVRGDRAAIASLPDDAKSAVTKLKFVAEPGSTATIPTVPKPKLDLHATVEPNTNLTGGEKVTVTWSGYTPGKVVNILQCGGSDQDLSNSAACDYTKAALLHADPTGSGSLELEIVEGKVGTDTCDVNHQGCFIVVNNASSPDPASSLKLPITFGS